MLSPPDDTDPMTRALASLRVRWQRWSAAHANTAAVAEALLYLALIALVAWLWRAPEADFRYWGF